VGSCEHCEHGNEPSGSIKGNFLLPEQLLASQGPCSMELVVVLKIKLCSTVI
jgi:hypothetical protein